MLKLTIIAATGVIALAAALAAAGVGRSSDPNRAQVSDGKMPSIEELHTRPHVKDLPVREVKEPF
jgi:hypothetical protein